MLPQLLVLLALLGPGSSLPLGSPWRDGAKAALGAVPVRTRRQVTLDEELDEDYHLEGTDPPEMLDSHTRVLGADTEPLPAMTTPGQRASTGPGTTEPATVDMATGGSVGPPAGHGAAGTWGRPVSGDLATELTTVIISTMAAPSTVSAQPAATEAKATQPAATEAETTQPAATEAETTQPAATEAETTQPAATEAETTQPAATEANATWRAATEGLAMKPTLMEAMFVKAQSTEPTATVARSTEPVTTKSQSIKPPATIAVVFEEKGVAQNTPEPTSHLPGRDQKAGQVVPPVSSVAPSPTGAAERIPVRQCLLAILILALVATIFLVCTVVLAVRLSRRSHMYPVRNYSPTEMVCISSLLPDAGEVGPAVANGGLPKSQRLMPEPLEDHDGDDLTLHSFLP
ncbi:P-selectin glycoprotein ligand 1 isoform X1 [Perognathus longimembris pacificus]|uniref:P-selectin glycoprotein ligand 1 isoform X1 n=1 Tax=Perognathus longimembris pacificus TaxID=214514 RepID=UPI0020187B90|nr:P-selectin glycoprotein ligand 1 isoform X1 [Perognathus longimembris pacificus]